ncbi:hypothetical protein EPI10_016781 [Gossypium australe]|uniref:Uncharacterized protein n=1 Tax=Gossypium australe TaxID=47621 RepID=A0A5B6VP57_9ROSI|nr:hypothetical protein EPI10_016781 [Gossypium australe]
MRTEVKQENWHWIPSNTKNKSQRERNEHVKAIDAKTKSKKVAEPVDRELEPTEEPFPSWLEDKQKHDEAEFVIFLNIIKSLNVNLSLIELIEKFPKYAKYLKENMSRHRKLKT